MKLKGEWFNRGRNITTNIEIPIPDKYIYAQKACVMRAFEDEEFLVLDGYKFKEVVKVVNLLNGDNYAHICKCDGENEVVDITDFHILHKPDGFDEWFFTMDGTKFSYRKLKIKPKNSPHEYEIHFDDYNKRSRELSVSEFVEEVFNTIEKDFYKFFKPDPDKLKDNILAKYLS